MEDCTPVFDKKAYDLAVHLKGFEAHIFGKENAKQFRDEMRMLLDMIKHPPYLSAAAREDSAENPLREHLINLLNGCGAERCFFDHHGNCQSHFVENPCSVMLARKALSEIKGGK